MPSSAGYLRSPPARGRRSNVQAAFIADRLTINYCCNEEALPGVAGIMESEYDLRQDSDGHWEVFCKGTGTVVVIGGLSLTAFDRVTANGIVGLLEKRIINADGFSDRKLRGPEDSDS